MYLSLHFEQHRDRYYELLDAVRRTGGRGANFLLRAHKALTEGTEPPEL